MREASVPQRLAIVAPTSAAFDSRTHRLAASVVERGHDVLVLARAEPGLAGDDRWASGGRVIRLPSGARDGLPFPGRAGLADLPLPARVTRFGPARMTRVWLEVRSQARAARELAPDVDLVHAMGFLGLPVGRAIVRRRPAAGLVYDARDIYSEARNIGRLPGPAKALFRTVERRWSRAAGLVVTTNEAYADVMSNLFGRRPLVVMNGCLPFDPQSPRPRLLHEALGLPDDTEVVLYHGGLVPDRGIEELIGAVPFLPPRAVLVLLGYGPLEPILRTRIAADGLAARCHLLPAVPPGELLMWVASADVAAMPIQPTSVNHRLTTPNKLFEAMAAGTPIVASDLPGMGPIVTEAQCGVLCDPTEPRAIAAAIREVLEAPAAIRAAMRDHAREAAVEQYSWAAQVEPLLAAYSRLTGRRW